MSGAAIRRVRAAWGADAPEWITVLAEECDRTSQAKAAKRIAYAPATVNQALGAKYPGNLGKVAAAVEAHLMGAVVDCPVMGEIPRAECSAIQGRAFAATNPQRVELWKHCHGQGGRPLCPNSQEGESP